MIFDQVFEIPLLSDTLFFAILLMKRAIAEISISFYFSSFFKIFIIN